VSPPNPAGLAARLAADGHLTDDWRPTFITVRREDYIPDRIWLRGEGGYRPLTRTADPEGWLRAVYSDTPIVTQVEDDSGVDVALVPSSSASMPRIVAEMLAALDVREGHRVLEVGTGTGYNAALLAARLGDRNITSIEVVPALADTARHSLQAAGYHPAVITGDGALGHPAGAPYDRVIVTCALADVPHPLIAQTAPGGILVAPWGTGLYNGVLVQLTVHHGPQGTVATGPVIGDSAFMWMRAHAPADRDVMAGIHPTDQAVDRTSLLDPRYVLGDPDAAFAIGAQHPALRYTVGHGDDGEFTLWLTDPTTQSWASLDYTPGATRFPVQQHGPRPLWDVVEAAYDTWRQAGSPGRTRYGLTIGPRGQALWLDTPDQAIYSAA
jgi:protein-L-isoaspartate(D-aspartate) O-methyltransferase